MKRILILSLLACGAASAASSLIFPEPRQIEFTPTNFNLSGASIILPAQPSQGDLKLARFLTEELSDRWSVQLPTRRGAQWPTTGRVIVMGSIANPLIRQYCRREHLDVTASSPGPEGYVLRVEANTIVIAGSDDRGAFYGLQSLRQLIVQNTSGAEARGVRVRDWPSKPFRGIKLYLPGHADIPFFRRYIRNFVALYKFNKLILEVGGSMRLDRHPEINAGFEEMARDTNYSRRNYAPEPFHGVVQNGPHHDVADGAFLEKSEVAELVGWVRDNDIEVIPEIPSLTHSFYLLARHRDLAEVTEHKWPDTYCPLNPGSDKLLFDVLEEYIEAIHPKMMHIGHDGWYTPIDICPRCKGKDYGELYGEDVKKIAEFLASRGIQTAMGSDMLVEDAHAKGPKQQVAPSGWHYRSPGPMTPEQVERLIPKNVLIFNAIWSGPNADAYDRQLEKFGLRQIYGSMETTLPNLSERLAGKNILGGATAAYGEVTALGFGKDSVYNIMGCASGLWTGQAPVKRALGELVQSRMRETRRGFEAEPAPSETDPVTTLDISPAYNMDSPDPIFHVDLSGLKQGQVQEGPLVFNLKDAGDKTAAAVGVEGREGHNPLPRESNAIPIGVDATSLIFLHACALPAANKMSYRLIWDQDETADLLGFYEVIYEDGFVQTLPIRYGVNILEWNWGHAPGIPGYRSIGGGNCYQGDPVKLGNNRQGPVAFFAYEWRNPRLGRVIKEVRLIGTTGFHSAVYGFENNFGDIIPNNAILLKAISYVKAR